MTKPRIKTKDIKKKKMQTHWTKICVLDDQSHQREWLVYLLGITTLGMIRDPDPQRGHSIVDGLTVTGLPQPVCLNTRVTTVLDSCRLSQRWILTGGGVDR